MTRLKKFKTLLWALAVLILTTAFAVVVIVTREKAPVSQTEFMLNTICTVTLYDWNGDGKALLEGAFDLCGQYEALLSATVSGSDVYQINHSHGNPTEISPDTARLISDAAEYSRLSDGAFDITIAPVKQLWHFSGRDDSVPEQTALDSAVRLVDYTKIQLDGCTVTLPDGMGIDLGAIAKGFTADKIAEYLRGKGVTSAVIDLGGNVLTIGSKPDGSRWRVGIQEPFAQSNIDVREVSDQSVVTSGVYQRYFEKDGMLYHHILSTTDGRPCETGLYSVTIIGDSSEECDALSTVCMLLGYERSKTLLENYPNTQAIFVTDQKELLVVGNDTNA